MIQTPMTSAVIQAPVICTIVNTPTPVCVVALGLDDAVMPGVGPLPVDLTSIGMTGCHLWHSSEVFGLSTVFSGQPFVIDCVFNLPGNSALMGLHVFTQAFSYAPGVNPLQVIASNGIDWLIGNQ